MNQMPDLPAATRAAALLAWRLSKEASELTERRRRREVRWLRRNAVESMRRAATAPGAPRRMREDLALMLENLVLTFIEQAPGRSLDGPLGEPDLLDEALSASREMIELQVGVVVESWRRSDSVRYELERSLERLAALSATRRDLVVKSRADRGELGPRLEQQGGPSHLHPDRAAVADHVAAAWELSQRIVPGNPLDTWRTRVANANAAVVHLRKAEALTEARSQIQQDLVYLLSGLARTLLDFADEDPGDVAAAVAASSEAVLRQAAILATSSVTALTERVTIDALETLATVHADFVAAREAAGLPYDGR